MLATGAVDSPTNSTTLSDTDYYARDDKEGFVIEAVVALPPESGINNQIKPSWPWDWNGSEAVVPSTNGDDSTKSEPVYRLRVRGTEDLELAYEIVQPDGTTDNLSVPLRRTIGLVRLSGDDRNDRDLRLVQGSALDRLLSDKALRSRLASELAKNDVQDELTDNAKEALKALDLAFKAKSLPHGLALAITGGQGLSITALIGLTAESEGVPLPLASWGAGTRRIAALTIAEQNQGDSPITLVDEAERGLEPYRQRSLMEKLQEGKSQVFVTTHSPVRHFRRVQSEPLVRRSCGQDRPARGSQDRKTSQERPRDISRAPRGCRRGRDRSRFRHRSSRKSAGFITPATRDSCHRRRRA